MVSEAGKKYTKEEGGFKVKLEQVYVGNELEISLYGTHFDDPEGKFIGLLDIKVFGF